MNQADVGADGVQISSVRRRHAAIHGGSRQPGNSLEVALGA